MSIVTPAPGASWASAGAVIRPTAATPQTNGFDLRMFSSVWSARRPVTPERSSRRVLTTALSVRKELQAGKLAGKCPPALRLVDREIEDDRREEDETLHGPHPRALEARGDESGFDDHHDET